ncbi:unnamed protein product, partial [Polarella glacialis]
MSLLPGGANGSEAGRSWSSAWRSCSRRDSRGTSAARSRSPVTSRCQRRFRGGAVEVGPLKLIVTVSRLDGSTVAEWTLPQSTTVAALQEKLRESTGIALSEQRLAAGTELLEGERCLGDLKELFDRSGAADGSVNLHLTLVRARAHLALSGGDDGTIRLWDLATGKEMQVLKNQTPDLGVSGLQVDWARQRALSCVDDFSLQLWDLKSGE